MIADPSGRGRKTVPVGRWLTLSFGAVVGGIALFVLWFFPARFETQALSLLKDESSTQARESTELEICSSKTARLRLMTCNQTGTTSSMPLERSSLLG